MRLIHTFNDPDQGKQFSQFLNAKNIEHQLEPLANNDWGSDDYGTIKINLWIIDEDQTEQATKWLELFKQDPTQKEFNVKIESPLEEIPFTPEEESSTEQKPIFQSAPPKDKSLITTYILCLCALLFIIAQFTRPHPTNIPEGIPLPPLLTAPINKSLMYDYPEKFKLIDKITALYGVDSLDSPNELPAEGQFLLKKSIETPYWQGLYKDIVKKVKEPDTPINLNNTPMFERIKSGEVWRLFTPSLLHFDIFHIFFNMVWLLVLGRQMEKQLGAFKYVFFILLTALISNTAQYLMSGSNFIGFSGVICGMIMFIWLRQKLAPWEGYHLHRSSMLFISIFV
ncbi:MAG: rhomboid family intramembrane serine protease, partial [Chlamydiota bacterium]|nr:rhomboid family intramembrane serine protease [Chlamydiota bacterium]